MKLFVNEKVFSIHNKFSILNESGELVYSVQSKALSLGHKTHVYDSNGNEIIYAEQEFFHILSKYKIFINGEYKFNINQKFRWFKTEFLIDNGYTLEGDIWSLNFSIKKGDNVVATAKRKMWTVADKYEFDIIDESDINSLLAIIIVLTNQINDDQTAAAAS